MTAAQHRNPLWRFKLSYKGLALLLLGAVVVVIGLVQTTSSHVTTGCPTGTELLAKFNFIGGHYVFEKPAGNQGVVVITNGTATGGHATSSIPIAATVIKASTDSKITTYDPPQSSVDFSNAGMTTPSGHLPDISNIQFCSSKTPPTTTTTTPPTTVPPTTTTTPPTTTQPPTTTTTPPTTTTTPPTTTQPPTTTSQPATTTTQPGTTTTQPGTTTTQPGTTTTVKSTTTTTSVPSTTTTSSTAAPTTTTTPPSTSGVTTTSSPPTTEGATTTTSAEQVSPPVTSTTIVPSETVLPATGTPSVPIILLGVALMVAGLTLIVVGRARERRAAGE